MGQYSAITRMRSQGAIAQVLLFLAIWTALASLVGLLAALPSILGWAGASSPIGHDSASALTPSSGTMLAISAGTAVATILAVWILRRFAGGPALFDLGLRPGPGWHAQIALGLALGPLVFLSILLVLLAAGWATVRSGGVDAPRLLTALAVYVLVAFSEEVVARGWVLQTIERGRGTTAGVVGSAGSFAALHAFNPDFTVVALLGLVLAGLLLAQAYVVSGQLWLPMALHFSWNASEGLLFGFPVSGLPSDGLLRVTISGPDMVTGGAFGPEGGLVVVVGIALASVAIFAFFRSAARWLRP